MVSLRWLFKMPDEQSSMVALFKEPGSEKNEAYLQFREIYTRLVRVTRRYMRGIVVHMPSAFLDQDRKLKRINPFIDIAGEDDPTSEFYPYDTEE